MKQHVQWRTITSGRRGSSFRAYRWRWALISEETKLALHALIFLPCLVSFFFVALPIPLLVLAPMSGEVLEEQAGYGRLPFDIFLSVSFPNLPLGSDLTLARRTGGITMPPETVGNSGSGSSGNGRG